MEDPLPVAVNGRPDPPRVEWCGVTQGANWWSRRWQDSAQPLFVALLFQAVIFVLVVADVPYAATAFVGGTIGCVIASLRMQRRNAH